MPDLPSWSEAWAQIRAAVRLVQGLRGFATTTSPNALALLDDLIVAAKGPFAAQTLAAAQNLRRDLSQAIARGRELLDPHLQHLAQLVGSTRRDPAGILQDVRTYMLAEDEAVATRTITRGSVTADSGNVGTGAIVTLTLDDAGDPIETGGGFTTVFECVADAQTGTQTGGERFDVRTADAGPVDWLPQALGSITRLRSRALAAEDGLLGNPSFRGFASGSPHPFGPWYTSSGVYTGFSHETTDGVRADRGTISPSQPTGTRRSLRVAPAAAAVPLHQRVPRDLDPTRPYVLQAWVKRVDSADGTLHLRLGSASTSVDVSTLSGWTRLTLLDGANAYYAQFATDPLTVQLELVGATTGHILVDEVLLAPLERFNGRWFAITPGPVDFRIGDRFEVSDTVGHDTGIQAWLDRFYGQTLPAASGLDITIAD